MLKNRKCKFEKNPQKGSSELSLFKVASICLCACTLESSKFVPFAWNKPNYWAGSRSWRHI